MTSKLDQTGDVNNLVLVKIARQVKLPDYVLSYQVEDTVKVAELQGNLFGDPITRSFPCHDKASTWLSFAYFQEKKAGIPRVKRAYIEERIKKAAESHGIAKDLEPLAEKLAASPSENHADYAWSHINAHGQFIGKLPIRNTSEVMKAAEFLAEHGYTFTFEDRNMMATRIYEKAAALGAGLGELMPVVEKQAGYGKPDRDGIIRAFTARKVLATPEFREKLAKCEESYRGLPAMAFTRETGIKMANMFYAIDAGLGIHNYSDSIQRPEDVIFGGTEKKAEEMVSTQSGKTYKQSHLSKVAYTDLKDLFGQEFADSVANGMNVDAEKLATEVAALPRPDAKLFDELMTSKRIAPVAVK